MKVLLVLAAAVAGFAWGMDFERSKTTQAASLLDQSIATTERCISALTKATAP